MVQQTAVLDGVTSPAGSRRNSTLRVDLWERLKDILVALLHVDERFASPVFLDCIGER